MGRSAGLLEGHLLPQPHPQAPTSDRACGASSSPGRGCREVGREAPPLSPPSPIPSLNPDPRRDPGSTRSPRQRSWGSSLGYLRRSCFFRLRQRQAPPRASQHQVVKLLPQTLCCLLPLRNLLVVYADGNRCSCLLQQDIQDPVPPSPGVAAASSPSPASETGRGRRRLAG